MTLNHHNRAVFAFPDSQAGAKALAKVLNVPLGIIDVHTFPDGETMPQLPFKAGDAILYRPLHHPNSKIFEVVQVLSALHDTGALKISFVCPYLPYMRQDKIFHEGQPLSQAVFARVISPWVHILIAVEPHLHRSHSMKSVFPDVTGTALSGGLALAEYYKTQGFDKNAIVLGPDEEAWHTAKPFAEALGLDWTVAEKKRHGDREVVVTLEDGQFKGRPVIIVDDVISSGMTIVKAAREARQAGANSVEAAGVHALFDKKAEAAFKDAGIKSVISCDGVPHPSNKAPLAPLIARALG